MITLPITVALKVDASQTSYQLGVNSNQYTIALHSDTAFNIVDADIYRGSYEVTPTDQDQTLNTEGLMMSDNLVVKKIPTNYGKVSYNGSYLTVS